MTSNHITADAQLELVVPVKSGREQPMGYLVGKFSTADLKSILYAREVCIEMGVECVSCRHELVHFARLEDLATSASKRIHLNATREELGRASGLPAMTVAPGVIVQANMFYLTSNTGDRGPEDTISDAIPITHAYYSKTVGFEEISPAELRAFLVESDGLAVDHGETV